MKVTLATLDQKLDALHEMVKGHIEQDERKFEKLGEILYGNGDPNKALITKVDRLEVAEGKRAWHLRALWTAVTATFVTWAYQNIPR